MNNLKVYRASAGAGKTFRLAVEYIALLVADPQAYKHILAVTFTNKATAEMKQRIMGQLYGIAHGLQSSDSYVSEIAKLTNVDPKVIAKRCDMALTAILHDYAHFHIVTIDSFFQSIVRELANELGLPANINVELNSDNVLRQAVDEIIDNLSTSSPEYDSLVRYIQSRIDDEKSWKITDTVVEFGKNLLNEHFLIHDSATRSSISNKGNLDAYRDRLMAFKTARTDTLNSIMASEQRVAMETIAATGCESGFTANAIKMISQDWSFCQEWKDTYQKHVDDPAKWAKKALLDNDEVMMTISGKLIPCLERVKDALTERLKLQNDVEAVLQHLYNLMIVGKISEQMDALNREHNRFLLAETAHFLRDVINQSNLPFIYEKTGTTFHHIMIDEFQDTSALQWQNFKPLLTECLDAGNSCLIVGDVKQSIYRFRNSDWKVLNNIDAPDAPLKPYIRNLNYNVNHRSAPTVVKFNNKFFEDAKKWLVEKYEDTLGSRVNALTTAYNSVAQDLKDAEKTHGYVSVVNAEDQAMQLECLQQSIERLVAAGVKQSDITILVRNVRHAVAICEYFNTAESNITVVSNEAFRLDASSAVCMIIDALRSLAAINDRLYLATLACHYQAMVVGNDFSLANICDADSIAQYLPTDFMERRYELRFMSIAEIVEEVYVMFQLSRLEGQDAYMLYFHDIVEQYAQDNLADIDSFLKAWDDELCGKTVPSGKTDGIRIMTIHKSKGLEFHTVIVPYCDWNLSPKDFTLLWHTSSDEADMPTLPLMPVNYSKTKNSKIFRDDHDDEALMTIVDNINVIYVAFTRAVNNLVIITDDKQPGHSKDSVGANTLVKAIIKPNQEEGNVIFAEGAIVKSEGDADRQKKVEEEEKELNPLTRKFIDEKVSFVSEGTMAQFRQSNEASLFVAQQSSTEAAQRKAHRMSLINLGNLYHNILQDVNTTDDIHTAVMRHDSRGCFEQVADRDEAEQQIRTMLDSIANEHPEWFSPEWTPINERAILCGDGLAQRPDRVVVKGDTAIVIDYKTAKGVAHVNADGTTTAPSDNVKQVAHYCKLIRQLGYRNVEGYLWYVLDGIIHKVG